jgi:hypothetical protein
VIVGEPAAATPRTIPVFFFMLCLLWSARVWLGLVGTEEAPAEEDDASP